MKKKLHFICLLLLLGSATYAQRVGIGIASPDSSAQLDISNTAKGILIPRMSTASISNIVRPAKSLMVYDTSRNELMVNMGTKTSPNWKSVTTNSSWNLTGNANTNTSLHFIGTMDNKPVQFRMNNKMAGKIDSVGFKTFYGYRAGVSSTAVGNTAFGYKAALSTTTGQSNTAVGANALLSNTVGNNNTAIGNEALLSCTACYHNVAVGHQAFKNNTTGVSNTIVGVNAAQLSTTGSSNTAIGLLALGHNTTGHSNTAIGADALRWTGASSNNTAVGKGAGESNNLGWNNTLIGAQCNAWSSDIFNSIGLGNDAAVTASNQTRIGNSATTSTGGYTGWTNISDGRYKKDIREDVKGIDFIMKLRPVTYHLDVTNLRIKLQESNENLVESGMQSAIAEKERMVQSGFIAQEVEQVAMELGYDFSGVDKPKNENDLYGLRYAEFVVPLVKAMQEQQLMIADLKRQNEDLLSRLGHVESELTSGDNNNQ